MLIAVALYASASAQRYADSASVLSAVTVTGVKKQTLRHTPFNISMLSAAQMQTGINYSISDALSKIPGVSQITTGSGISKPVIRGLYGNRIQTVLLGLRFDNQQWQDEHGLGLSIIGIDRIEVLKGPSSLLYGAEAIGGVIKIVEENIPTANTEESDINGSLFSNTLGFSVNGGIKKNTGSKNWRIRLGADNHADYSDGDNTRILNSRFESYNFKASLGLSHKRWINQNNFYTSFSRFGFVMKDNRERKPVDNRAGRKLDGPNHAVLFNILSTENTLLLPHSKIELNGGVHSNLRLENEGGNHISLNMFLNTITYNAKWFKPIGDNTELILGNESQYQVNTNFGSRVIIPDAHLFETSLSAYIKKRTKTFDVETGISLSERNITTRHTENMDYSSGAIYPFSRWYPSVNGNAGLSFNPNKEWNIKLNASTGYRSPNLAELSSNGLHEGTFRYEIGNPKMIAEQNLNTEVNINYESNFVDFYSAVYINAFRNYIYLAPTGTELYGFDIYRFLQVNAKLYGGEISTKVKFSKKVFLETSFSKVTGKLAYGKYLPFIPSNKLVNNITLKPVKNFTWKTGVDLVFAQNHTGDFETPTAQYWLLHTSLQHILHRGKKQMNLCISGENLLNRKYYDHLSRFKYFGIFNPGRNISLTLSIPFTKKINKL